MTTEEFQRLVLEKFDNLEVRFDNLDTRFHNLETSFDNLDTRFHNLETSFDNSETRFDTLETRFDNLEQGQIDIKKDIKAIREQTADLTEFRGEVKDKLDTLLQESLSIHGGDI